jgi:hypothetical protein
MPSLYIRANTLDADMMAETTHKGKKKQKLVLAYWSMGSTDPQTRQTSDGLRGSFADDLADDGSFSRPGIKIHEDDLLPGSERELAVNYRHAQRRP